MRNDKGRFIKGHAPHPNWIAKWIKPRRTFDCPICGLLVEVPNTSQRKSCSRECGNKLGGLKRALASEENYNLNNQYQRQTARQHKYEHRVVMERVLGRSLSRDEQVHHINGNKLDNRPANLLVLSNKDHQALHRELHRGPLKCVVCSATYIGDTRRSIYCSRRCLKKAYRRRLSDANRKLS